MVNKKSLNLQNQLWGEVFAPYAPGSGAKFGMYLWGECGMCQCVYEWTSLSVYESGVLVCVCTGVCLRVFGVYMSVVYLCICLCMCVY